MGIDVENTLATLSAHRAITDALIEQHGGRICGMTFPRWPTGSTVPRRHIAWGLLARDNDAIQADSPFGLRHIFHRHISIHNLKDRLTVIWLGRSVSKRIFRRAVLVARVTDFGTTTRTSP